MKKDGVSTAFDMILDEIAAVQDQLGIEGSSAFKESRYQDAERLSDAGKKLLGFRQKLESLRDEWKKGIDVATRERVKIESAYTISPHSKGAKTVLRVILPSGQVVQRPAAADTFADCIQHLGLDVIKEINLSVNNVPLLSRTRHKKYTQSKRGPYYICTHSNTKSKKALLLDIGNRLGERLQVQIIDARDGVS
jgi:hypothetical protein